MASNQPVLFPVLIDAATDPLVRAVAVCLARYCGQTCVHTESDLRDFLVWCRERGLEPLNASRAQVELYVRWMQEVRNFHALVTMLGLLGLRIFEACGATMLDAGADLRDAQIAARHADPRTTMRYDRARKNLDRHPN